MRRPLVLVLALVACREHGAATRPPVAPTPAPTTAPTPAPTTAPVPPAPVEPAPAPAPPPDDPDDPPPSRSVLHVSFRIDPVVGDKSPVLIVGVRNRGAQPVAFMRFTDPRCFASHHLALKIARRGKPVALSPCAVKDWPGTPTSIAAAGEERMVLPLAELASAWPRGTYTIAVDYDPVELERATGETAAHASQSSLNSEQFTIARLLKQFRVLAGKSVTLPDGVTLKFAGHSHKDVGPGDSSPLIIGGTITLARGEAEQFHASIHPPEDRLFTLGDGRVFELVGHSYDEWMDLRYFGRIPSLRP